MLDEKKRALYKKACELHAGELGRELTWYERARLLRAFKNGAKYGIETKTGIRLYRSGEKVSREINSTTGGLIRLTEVLEFDNKG